MEVMAEERRPQQRPLILPNLFNPTRYIDEILPSAPEAVSSSEILGITPESSFTMATEAPSSVLLPGETGVTATGSFLPALGITAGALVGAQQFGGARSIAEGKKPSAMESAALFPLDGGASLFAGEFGSGKNPRQQQRDSGRSFIAQTLGTEDKPGARTVQGLNGRELSIEHHELDPAKNPLQAEAIAYADPIAELLAGGDESKRADLSALIARAVADQSNNSSEVAGNTALIANRLGVGPEATRRFLAESYDKGAIDSERFRVNLANLGRMTGRSLGEELQAASRYSRRLKQNG